MLATRRQQVLPFEALDDLGPRGRCSYPLRLLQPLAVLGVLDEAPGVRHGLDQRPLIVTRRRLRLFCFDLWPAQANLLPIPQGGQRLVVLVVPAVVTVVVIFLTERGPPAN